MLLDVHGHPSIDRSRLPDLIAALERWDARLLLADLGASDGGWLHDPEVPHWRSGNELCATTGSSATVTSTRSTPGRRSTRWSSASTGSATCSGR